jgi:hypothetical protein
MIQKSLSEGLFRLFRGNKIHSNGKFKLWKIEERQIDNNHFTHAQNIEFNGLVKNYNKLSPREQHFIQGDLD